MKFHDSTVIICDHSCDHSCDDPGASNSFQSISERVLASSSSTTGHSPQGHQLELRIKSEVTAGGQLRKRNQPLAVVLRNNEHGQWEQAVGGSQQLQILRDTSQQDTDDTEQ